MIVGVVFLVSDKSKETSGVARSDLRLNLHFFIKSVKIQPNKKTIHYIWSHFNIT